MKKSNELKLKPKLDTGTLMDLWKSGRRMPFIVRDPRSGQTIAIESYYWPGGFFVGSMNDVELGLSDAEVWEFVKEA